MWQTPKTDWESTDTLDATIDLRRISQNIHYLTEVLGNKNKVINTQLVSDVTLFDSQSEMLEDLNGSVLCDFDFWEYESFMKKSRFENYLDVINEICAVCVTAPLSQMTIDSLSYEMLNCLESKINSLKEIAEQRNYRYMLDFILGVQNVY